jgi:hypothetical protein
LWSGENGPSLAEPTTPLQAMAAAAFYRLARPKLAQLRWEPLSMRLARDRVEDDWSAWNLDQSVLKSEIQVSNIISCFQ